MGAASTSITTCGCCVQRRKLTRASRWRSRCDPFDHRPDSLIIRAREGPMTKGGPIGPPFSLPSAESIHRWGTHVASSSGNASDPTPRLAWSALEPDARFQSYGHCCVPGEGRPARKWLHDNLPRYGITRAFELVECRALSQEETHENQTRPFNDARRTRRACCMWE